MIGRRPRLSLPGAALGPGRVAVCLAALGAVAWVAALLLWLIGIPTERERLVSLRRDADRSAAMAPGHGMAAAEGTTGPAPSQRFLAAFPPATIRPERIAAILDTAAINKLVWQRTDFRSSPTGFTGLSRQEMTLPLAGSYLGVRDFIVQALGTDPALVLERLQLRRKSAGTAGLEIETVWSLYDRDPAAGPVPAAPTPRQSALRR